METTFDLNRLAEEQLRQLIEEAQAALLERQRVYLRECSVEQANKNISPKVQKVCVFRLTRDDEWTNRTRLTVLERKESEPTFGTFTARVGEVIELKFVARRSQSRLWYVVCEDGSLKKLLEYQKEELAEAYLEGDFNLMTFLQKLDAKEVWDSDIL